MLRTGNSQSGTLTLRSVKKTVSKLEELLNFLAQARIHECDDEKTSLR